MAGLDITNISAPSAVLEGSSFRIDVSVTASPDVFQDRHAYRLFILVSGLNLHQLIPLTGHLQDPPWHTPSTVIPVSVTAGSSPDIYTITAALMEGSGGVVPHWVPSFGSAGPIMVV